MPDPVILRFSYLAALLVIVMPASSAIAPAKKSLCKVSEFAPSCYWTRGRLFSPSGTPAFRLRKIGTKRILGIYSSRADYLKDLSGKSLDNEQPHFPSNLAVRFRPHENDIVADFEVCPLMLETPQAMQPACIESAKNIHVVDLK